MSERATNNAQIKAYRAILNECVEGMNRSPEQLKEALDFADKLRLYSQDDRVKFNCVKLITDIKLELAKMLLDAEQYENPKVQKHEHDVRIPQIIEVKLV